IAVDAVGDRNIDEAVLAPDRHRRLGAEHGERIKASAAAAAENKAQDIMRHGWFPFDWVDDRDMVSSVRGGGEENSAKKLEIRVLAALGRGAQRSGPEKEENDYDED